MDPRIVATLSFIAAFLAVVAANALIIDLTSRERKRMRQRLEEQFRARHRDKVRRESIDFSKLAAEALSERKTNTVLDKAKFVLEQSGLNITWSKLVMLTVASSCALGALAFVALRQLPVTVVAATIGSGIPFGYVAVKRHQRLNLLREQFPDALELMGRVLRSGQTITQGMQGISDEFDRPISLEFLYCYEQMNMGLSAEVALKQLARRTGLLEIKIFVLAVIVQRQTGGNLAELLDKLGAVIRDRFRIHGMIQSLTAQGRLQAIIMLSLPPAMFVVLMLINSNYMMRLFEMPRAIALALSLMGVGWVWCNRIVNFDY